MATVAVVLTTVPSTSVMVMATVSPGATSVEVPDRSTVSLALSTSSIAKVRLPAVAFKVPVSESETELPLRSVAEALTVRLPSTRLETSTPETA